MTDMAELKKSEEEITREGNPRKPQGEEGKAMLERMNRSHYEVTGWALDHWTIREDDQVLDIGCGGGMTLHRMAEKLTTGHATGVDYSGVSVAESGKLNEESVKEGKVTVLEASVEKLPFEDDTFDKIITVESFYFWPDPQENLKEVRRVLKKDGTFLLVADIYENGHLTGQQKENIARYELFNPTEEEFREIFTKAGFAKVKIHTRDGENWICVEGHK